MDLVEIISFRVIVKTRKERFLFLFFGKSRRMLGSFDIFEKMYLEIYNKGYKE